MQLPDALQAVLFDMDGLLLDTERLARDIWYAVARERGYELTDAIYLPILGTNVAGTKRVIQDAFGHATPVDAMHREKHHRLEAAIRAGQVPVKPGASALLDTLSARGIRAAVATSTGHALARLKLQVTGLLPRFEALAGGDEVTHGKPAPDVYLLAAARLGVNPARCLALEDSANGVRAARAAGMPVIMVPDLAPATPEMLALATAVMPDLFAVRDLFGAAAVALERRA
jgi:HAD superfamily hydrolase (TIGR01509 family)